MCDVIYVHKHYRENIFSHNSAVFKGNHPISFLYGWEIDPRTYCENRIEQPYLTGKQYTQSEGLLERLRLEARAPQLLIRSSGSTTTDTELGYHHFRLNRDSGPITCTGVPRRTGLPTRIARHAIHC